LLSAPWSGRYRYCVSGSLVEFDGQRHGRETIRKLLASVTNAEALKILNTTEARLIEEWKARVAGLR
jgi:hypothetical protein